jgi:hypothetical protein
MKAQPTFIYYGANKNKCSDLISGTTENPYEAPKPSAPVLIVSPTPEHTKPAYSKPSPAYTEPAKPKPEYTETPAYTKPEPAYTKKVETKPTPAYSKPAPTVPILIASPTPEYIKPKEEYKPKKEYKQEPKPEYKEKPAYTKPSEPAYTKKVDTSPTPAYSKPPPTVPILIATPTPEYTKPSNPEYTKPKEEYKPKKEYKQEPKQEYSEKPAYTKSSEPAYTKEVDVKPTPAYSKTAPTVPILIVTPTPEYSKSSYAKPTPSYTKPKKEYKPKKAAKKEYKKKQRKNSYRVSTRPASKTKKTKPSYSKPTQSVKFEYKTIPDASCKNDEYKCTDTAVKRCVYGEWVEYSCATGTHCVWNSWVCAGPKAIEKKYRKETYGAEKKPCEELVKDVVLYEADTTPVEEDSECTHAEYSCTDYSTRRCNFGKWVDYSCASGLHCVWENYVCADIPTMETHYSEGHYGADKKPCSALINGTVTEPPRTEEPTVAEDAPIASPTEAEEVEDSAETSSETQNNVEPETTSTGEPLEDLESTDDIPEATNSEELAEETSEIETFTDNIPAATTTEGTSLIEGDGSVPTIDVIDGGIAPIGGAGNEEPVIPIAQEATAGSRVTLSVLLIVAALAFHL